MTGNNEEEEYSNEDRVNKIQKAAHVYIVILHVETPTVQKQFLQRVNH